MRIGGQYVGLGLGDSSEEVRKIKAHMRKKFSYAKDLADTPLFDDAMVAAVVEMQNRYVNAGKLAAGKYTSGIINAETKYVMGFIPRPGSVPPPGSSIDNRPVLFTVCGTGVPWWVGPDADLARAVEHKYRWQPCAYPAAPFPMGKSITAGKESLATQFERAEPGFMLREQVERCGAALAGYSQGAVITSEVWMQWIKPDGGRLRWAKDHIEKAVTWGNPSREQGKAYADPGGQIADADSHGVAYPTDRMQDTPSWWRDYAHHGDLYTECSGQSAENKTAIWRIIRGEKFFLGPDTLLEQVFELLGVKKDASRIIEVTAAFKAMWDAGMFFGKGTGPHITYNIDPAVQYLLS